MSEILYKVISTIMALFFSVWGVFVPMNPDKVVFEAEPLTAESEYIYIQCENLTGRMIAEPQATKLMKSVDGEWETVADIPVLESTGGLIYPGQSATVFKGRISRYCESETLEPGEYKMTFIYDVIVFSREKGEESIKMEAEVIFNVTEIAV